MWGDIPVGGISRRGGVLDCATASRPSAVARYSSEYRINGWRPTQTSLLRRCPGVTPPLPLDRTTPTKPLNILANILNCFMWIAAKTGLEQSPGLNRSSLYEHPTRKRIRSCDSFLPPGWLIMRREGADGWTCEAKLTYFIISSRLSRNCLRRS